MFANGYVGRKTSFESLRRFQEVIRELNADLEADKNRLAQTSQEVSRYQHAAAAARARSDSAAANATELFPRDSRTAREVLDALPDDPAECDLAAAVLTDKAQAIAVGDEGVVQRYNALIKEITQREATNAKLTAQVHKYKVRCECHYHRKHLHVPITSD